MGERYRLKRLLARGGMAEVYLGVALGEEGFEKPVAIKRVLPEFSTDERLLRMFVSEARLATFLNHQNIVQVTDVGKSDRGLYIVMELVNGWNLENVLQRATDQKIQMPPALCAFVCAQVVSGLCHAYRREHQRRKIVVAHRDLSPSNILLSEEGEVKVADFGIARLDALSSGTEPGVFKGKIPYAAPEILQGRPANAASDQFALGIILYEMLSGRHPFEAPDLASFTNAILEATPAPLQTAPAQLREITQRALQKKPGSRFPSPELFGRSISQFLASSGAPAFAVELSQFLSSLGLPPPPLALPAGDTVMGETLLSLSRSNSSASSHFDALQLNEDWQPIGSVMSSEGKIESSRHSPPKGPVKAEVQPEHRCPKCGHELLTSWARCKWCEKEKDPFESEKKEVLEIEKQARYTPNVDISRLEVGQDVKRSSWRPVILVGVTFSAVALGGIGVWHFRTTSFTQWEKRSASERVLDVQANTSSILSINSTPSGATVRVSGNKVGTTPMFMENTYVGEKVPVQISLQGYQSWTGNFRGGVKATVDAKLRQK